VQSAKRKVQSYNAKLKIIFITLAVLAFSGCMKNASLTKNNNIPEQAAPIQVADIQNKEQIKIFFVGDMMFDRYIREGVRKYGGGDYNYVFSQIKDRLAGYDLVIGNLEGPITDKSSVSVGTAMEEKKNLVFTFDPAVAKALADNNIKLVDLGNNHILNQNEDGITQTKKYLDEAGVQCFGDTGEMEVELSRGSSTSKVVNISGIKIGFVNYNYSIAGSFEKAIEDIGDLKKKSDIVVVCPHWGTEYKVGDPGQEIKNEAYKFIDAGADAIIGGHPHVAQDSEIYKNKKIYYSLGNFIFDQYFQKETMEGLGVELTVKPDLTMEFGEVKFEMNKRGQTTVR
jgi:poly-gamma-glutamate synthesis protein (capsule biosynthesis protein)